MRAVLGIIVGFAVATAAITALSFAGTSDPALIGAAHIAVWVVVAVVIARSGRDRPDEQTASSPIADVSESATDPPIGPNGPSVVAGSELAETEDKVAANSDDPVLSKQRTERTRTSAWLVGLATFGALTLVAALGSLSGFIGARVAMEGIAATAAPNVPEEDPTTWHDLIVAEKVHCLTALFPDADVPPLRLAGLAVTAGHEDVSRWLESYFLDFGGSRFERERTLVVACRALYDSRFPRQSTP